MLLLSILFHDYYPISKIAMAGMFKHYINP